MARIVPESLREAYNATAVNPPRFPLRCVRRRSRMVLKCDRASPTAGVLGRSGRASGALHRLGPLVDSPVCRRGISHGLTGAIRRVVGGIAVSLEARRAASRGRRSSFVVVVDRSVLNVEGKPRGESQDIERGGGRQTSLPLLISE